MTRFEESISRISVRGGVQATSEVTVLDAVWHGSLHIEPKEKDRAGIPKETGL